MLPITRTKPVMKAECGRNFSSMRFSIRLAAPPSCVGAVTDFAVRNFMPINSMNAKLNTSMDAFTMRLPKKDENPVNAIVQ